MSDIQQWRRMVQPSRSRTPAAELDTATGENSNTMPTPKKKLRPKLSRYFSEHNTLGAGLRDDTALQDENTVPDLPSWVVPDPFPRPEAEGQMDAILCHLMSQPYASLEPRYNSMLLQIFEAYRNLKDGKNELETKLEEEVEKQHTVRQALRRFEEKYDDEIAAYKKEVKRLEVILAKGKTGLAAVTRARQDSVLHRRDRRGADDGKETIIEFLEKTRLFEDRGWSSQRATMRARPPSPSRSMQALSKSLSKKQSMTSILAELPFGTPPEMPSTLAEVSTIENKAAKASATHSKQRASSGVQTCASDDTFSTFSDTSNVLSDAANSQQDQQDCFVNDELISLHRLAHVLAHRRGVTVESVIQRLRELFTKEILDDQVANTTEQGLKGPLPAPAPLAKRPTQTLPAAPGLAGKNTRLRAKASGFMQKLKPQLSLDTSLGHGRRFSFDPGDDAIVSGASCKEPESKAADALRKSVSMGSLPESGQRELLRPVADLSPIASSPTTSLLSEPRRASKIPTPTHTAGKLSRPRPDRGDSISSMVTAIKYSQGIASQQSGPASGTAYSSPRASLKSEAAVSNSGGYQIAANKNLLFNHANSLRGQQAVAATAAATAMHMDADGRANRTGLKDSAQSSGISDDQSQCNITKVCTAVLEENRRPTMQAQAQSQTHNLRPS